MALPRTTNYIKLTHNKLSPQCTSSQNILAPPLSALRSTSLSPNQFPYSQLLIWIDGAVCLVKLHTCGSSTIRASNTLQYTQSLHSLLSSSHRTNFPKCRTGYTFSQRSFTQLRFFHFFPEGYTVTHSEQPPQGFFTFTRYLFFSHFAITKNTKFSPKPKVLYSASLKSRPSHWPFPLLPAPLFLCSCFLPSPALRFTSLKSRPSHSPFSLPLASSPALRFTSLKSRPKSSPLRLEVFRNWL